MSQVFSFKRYVWLVKRQWYENAAIYKWGIVLLVLVTGLLFGLFGDWKPHGELQQTRFKDVPVFLVTVVIFMYIYAAWFFDSLSSKHKKMFYFSLPVLPLERTVLTFTFVMVLVPIILLAVFIISDFITIQLFNHIHEVSEQMFFQQIFEPFSRESEQIAYLALWGHLSITSVFALGSLIFGKKGPVISIFFMIVCSYIYYKLLDMFLYIFQNANFKNAHEDVLYNKFLYAFIFAFIFCWIAMYFAMKKKEA